MQEFKKLKIWQKAMELSVDIYNITSQYPKTEVFGLVSQMRRAAVSVVSNIAEGAGRNSPKEFIRFLSYAQASSTELETQLLLSTQVGLIELPAQKSIEEKLLEVQKMNRALQTKINQNISKKER
ncbi:MAG: hypothetical protein RLZZ262_618 [Bacteroidota bacterium]|jgi:four helix bundle protein